MGRLVPVAKALFHRVQTTDTAAYAAALAYNFLFALFPLLLLLTALLGLLHLPSIANFFRGPARVLMAPSLRHLILAVTTEARRHRSPTLISLGAIGFIWAMSGAIRQLIDALNHAYRIARPKRRIWVTILLSVGLGLLVGILLTIAEAIMALGGDAIAWLSSGVVHQPVSPLLMEWIRWAVLLALMWIVLTVVYNWLPDHVERVHWMTPGTGAVMVLWILISAGFAFYVSHFNHYNKTYGSLGAVILLMLYLYILSFALLLGAELNAIWFTDASEP